MLGTSVSRRFTLRIPMPPTLRSTLFRSAAVAGVALVVGRAAAEAQSSRTAAAPQPDNARVRALLQLLRDDNAWTLAQQTSICEIPAPPFGEARRAAEYRRRLAALGLRARIDSIGNAIAERPGAGEGPTVVIAGHLDTVFPEGTDVRPRRAGARIMGPGIGDDCRGLAVVLAVARAFQRADLRTNGSVIFVGNVGEEGPGNLRGVRYLYANELKGRPVYFISVDGAGLGLTSRAVGSNRYRVTYKGPGGHSYGDFGMPSPIHALGRAIARIADLQVAASPKTTFNVGVVRGGTSVNSIAFEASMDLDMRSESAEALADLDARVRRVLAEALEVENARARDARSRLTLVIDTIGIRPAGAQPDTAAIVRVAQAAATALGFTATPGASSTDANVPISLGLPGITIDGGGRGEGSHSLEEWYEDGPNGWLGPQWAALIVAALAGVK
jgi:acetylornithine deacetylase/succinyl-diaminopimelate desuccinylase-like protein